MHSTFFWLNISIVIALCPNVPLAAEIPSQTFSINNATVGVTTLDEIRKTYGEAKPSKVGPGDGADETICYTSSSPKGRSFVIFETGAMGGWTQITGFRISTLRQSGNCFSTKIDIGALATGNGVKLGQSLVDFEKAIPVEFKRLGSELTYEAVSRRAATQEELKKLRAKWPDEKRDYFDVTINLIAKFKDNRLIDFYVHKIESY